MRPSGWDFDTVRMLLDLEEFVAEFGDASERACAARNAEFYREVLASEGVRPIDE